MKKPVSMRVLAFLAALLTGAVIALQIFAVFRPDTYAGMFSAGKEIIDAEIPKLSRTLFMMKGVGILPLTILFLVNGFAGKVSRPRSIITVILIAVFSIVRSAGDIYFSTMANIEANNAGQKAAALADIINRAGSMAGWLGFLAMMLMCCAAGAEFYAAKHSGTKEE
ncbi:MAG: hypothetical protein J5501_06340 [Ruminococcus sp.]|nr:hypothetical protein [Ruminococcus sp.]